MLKSRQKLYRKLYLLLALSLMLIIVFFAVQKKPKILNGVRIKIVDQIGDNYLIRGSNPFTYQDGNRIFNYQDLKKYINETLQNNGKEPLEDFYLIDISLLNIDAYFQIKQEQDFFKKNPQLGMVENYSEIAPELLLMPFYNNKLINKITYNYHRDLDAIIAKIYTKLSQKHAKPIIIYMHCNAGRDRTGVISAVYRMSYKNMNLQQVIEQNFIDVGRNSEYLLADTITSYCHYLKRHHAKDDNFCLFKQIY